MCSPEREITDKLRLAIASPPLAAHRLADEAERLSRPFSDECARWSMPNINWWKEVELSFRLLSQSYCADGQLSAFLLKRKAERAHGAARYWLDVLEEERMEKELEAAETMGGVQP